MSHILNEAKSNPLTSAVFTMHCGIRFYARQTAPCYLEKEGNRASCLACKSALFAKQLEEIKASVWRSAPKEALTFDPGPSKL